MRCMVLRSRLRRYFGLSFMLSTSRFRLRIPTRVGLRAAMLPRAEESAPTQLGAKIMDWVALPHTRGVTHAMHGPAQQAAALLRALLHAFDFILPTSHPHTRGVTGSDAAQGGIIRPYTVGCQDFGLACSSPHAWGLKGFFRPPCPRCALFPTRVGSETKQQP
jgi:hypothetical protein